MIALPEVIPFVGTYCITKTFHCNNLSLSFVSLAPDVPTMILVSDIINLGSSRWRADFKDWSTDLAAMPIRWWGWPLIWRRTKQGRMSNGETDTTRTLSDPICPLDNMKVSQFSFLSNQLNKFWWRGLYSGKWQRIKNYNQPSVKQSWNID